MKPGELDGVLEHLERLLRHDGYPEQASSVQRARSSLADFVAEVARIEGFGQVFDLSVSLDITLSPREQ